MHRVTDRLRDAYVRLLARTLDDIPEHVAIIQDGNRRYARRHDLDTTAGHSAGAETARDVLQWGRDLGITETTLYAFSTENFERPPEERAALFDLIAEQLYELVDDERIHDDRVRVRAIGDVERLPERVREAIAAVEGATETYGQYVLNVALAYGGRDVLLSAAQRIAKRAAEGDLDPSNIDPDKVAAELYDRPFRDVDLLIRSGGECRTSNFLPWHAVGAEAPMAVVASYWPEFSQLDFLRALGVYDKYSDAKADGQPRGGLRSRIRQPSEVVSGLRSVLHSFRR